jgi:hypothetical protein
MYVYICTRCPHTHTHTHTEALASIEYAAGFCGTYKHANIYVYDIHTRTHTNKH